tara:strand:- start:1801 stop:3126 length:1326 start_codon:yes stop_codon:yes gene_type:complete
MIQYLVFPNGTASTSLQKDVIVNWSNVKYMKIDGVELVLELNNGGSIRLSITNFGSGLDAAVHVMETIQDLVKSNPNGKVLKVKPDFFKQWGMVDIVYTAPSTGSGVTSIVAGTNVTINPVGGTGNVTVNALSELLTRIDADDTIILGSSPTNSGGNNTSLGSEAMQSISSSADSNVAVGANALKNCNSDDNIAIGYNALTAHVDGNRNIAIGYDCMELSGDSEGASNSNNTFVGGQSGQDIDEGCNDNVGIGRSALGNLGSGGTVGSQNTALGTSAGSNLSGAATNNTFVGYDAEPTASSVSNEFVLGNSSVGVLRCQQTTITALSDERDKTSIEDLPYGLDFVDSLKPKRFVWDNRAETRFVDDEEGKNLVEEEYFSANKGKKDIGFIAQELQTVDDEFLNLVYDSNPEKLEASYGKLIPVLVKAIQELKVQLDNKQDK